MKNKSLFLFLFLFTNYFYSQEAKEKNYATFNEFITDQNAKISTIENGLNTLEVQKIMGTSIIVKVPKIGKMKALSQLFKQPEFKKKFINKSKQDVKVFWYFSRPKNQDGIISKSECIPIMIKNDTVVGKGTKFYLNFMRKEQFRF